MVGVGMAQRSAHLHQLRGPCRLRQRHAQSARTLQRQRQILLVQADAKARRKRAPDHAIAMARFAIDMRSELQRINEILGESIDIRIGINSGPVVAGVIGTKKFIYDLWGDAVNVASRMESHGKPGEIHMSATTYEKLRSSFHMESRGTVYIKGKGDMETYWLRDEI